MVLRLAIFASGKGSNLRAIYNAIRQQTLSGVELVLVLSNNSNSDALVFAKEHHIAGVHLSQVSVGGDEHTYEQAMLRVLAEHKIDLIALAGYMKKIPEAVIAVYKKRIVNVHPSLLPEFGGAGMFGLNVHQAVLTASKATSGMTIHFVDHDYDAGEIILQEQCPVLPNDTAETLSKRVLALEHHFYPKALQIVVQSLSQQQPDGAPRKN